MKPTGEGRSITDRRQGEIPVDPDDLEVVNAVLAGRTESYSVLVRRYQRLVGSVAYRMGVPADDTEDVVSEVFIKVYENLRRYRPDHALSTWIYRIAVNHVLDHKRRHRHERGWTEVNEKLVDPGAPPSAGVERMEVAMRVRRLLPLLESKYRQVLVLMHVEEKKVEEISEILGLPSGTVKTRLARGRVRLAEIIRRHDPALMKEDPIQ